MRSLGKTRIFTIRLYCFVGHHVVTKCINYFLRNLIVTSCTMRSLGKTRVFTIGCYGLIGHHVVTKCGNYFLLNLMITSRTMRSLGKTRVFTTGRYRLVSHHVVAKCIYNRLRNENCITYRAVLAFGQTGCRTSGSNCCINHFCMTKCGNSNRYTAKFCFANCTINYIIIGTVIFTIGGNVVFNNDITCSMISYRNYLLRNENCITYRAVLTLGQTGCRTSGSNCCIDNLGMTKCGSFNCVRITASASVGCVTCLCTCRICYYRTIGMLVFVNRYRSNGFLTVGIVVDDDLSRADTAKGQSSLCPIGGVGSVDRANGASLAYGRNEYHQGVCIDRNAVKSLENLTDGKGSALLIVGAVCKNIELIDGVSFFSIENGDTIKIKLGVISEADGLYAPAVALNELVEGQVHDLLIFLEDGLAIDNLGACILVEMADKRAFFTYDVVAFTIQEEVTSLFPSVAGLDFVKRRNLGQAAELVVMRVGCERVCNKLTVIVVIPIAKVNGGIASGNTGGIGNGISVNGDVLATDRTDHHTGITIPVVLIVTANVVVNIDLCTDITVFKVNQSVATEHTHNTTAGNVPRAPQSGDLVGIVNGNIRKGQSGCICIAAVATDTHDTTVTRVVHAGVTVGNRDIRKGCISRISRDDTRGGELTVGGEIGDGQVLDGTTVHITENTHSGIPIVAVVVALQLPGVLVDVRNRITVSIENALECATVGVPNSGLVSIDRIHGGSCIILACIIETEELGSIIHVNGCEITAHPGITNGIEDNAIGGVLFAAEVNVRNQLIVLVTVVCVIIGNLISEKCQLVGVCDQIRLGFSTVTAGEIGCYGSVPSILGIGDQGYLGEGCQVQNHVARCGIVLEIVMYGGCAVGKQGHLNGPAVLYVVETVVTHVQTHGQELLEADCDDNGVVRGDTCDVHVDGASLLGCLNRNVCLRLVIRDVIDRQGQAVCTVLQENARRNGGSIIAARHTHGQRLGKLALRVGVHAGRDRILAHDEVIGPLDVRVIIRAECIRLSAELSCHQIDGEAIAKVGVLQVIACGLAHVEGNRQDGVLVALKHAVGGRIMLYDLGKNACALKTAQGSEGLGDGVDVVHVNDVCQRGHGSLCGNIQFPLQREASLVDDLNVLDVGIAGLPIFMGENGTLGLRPLLGICIQKRVRPVHFNVQVATLHHVVGAGYRCRKPRVGGSQQHGSAQQQTQHTCEQ